jgi:coenzyme PQQ synthesis protein D (PqqD)
MSAGHAVGWEDIVSVAQDQVSSRVGNEVAILSLNKAVYYGLNPVGARIWELVQSPMQVKRIHQVLIEHYDVDSETAKEDLMEILDQLLAEGLVGLRNENTP